MGGRRSEEEMKWLPAIDKEKCVSRGMCMNRGKNVYDRIENRPKVTNPYSCVVGCSSCANVCLGRAISAS